MGESAEDKTAVATGGPVRSVGRPRRLRPGDQRRDVGDRRPATEVVRRHVAAGSGRGGARPRQRRLGWRRTDDRVGGLAAGRAARDRCSRSIRRRAGLPRCTGRCWSCVWWASRWARGRSHCGRAGSRWPRLSESDCPAEVLVRCCGSLPSPCSWVRWSPGRFRPHTLSRPAAAPSGSAPAWPPRRPGICCCCSTSPAACRAPTRRPRGCRRPVTCYRR